jgi:cytochrome c oxidase subunit I
MTAVGPKPITSRPYPVRRTAKGAALVRVLRTTEPKDIAILCLIPSFAFFLIDRGMALLIRGELATPGQQFLRCPARDRHVLPRPP